MATVPPIAAPATRAHGADNPPIVVPAIKADGVDPVIIADPATEAAIPATVVDIPATEAIIPAIAADTLATEAIIPVIAADTPATEAIIPAIAADTPVTEADGVASLVIAVDNPAGKDSPAIKAAGTGNPLIAADRMVSVTLSVMAATRRLPVPMPIVLLSATMATVPLVGKAGSPPSEPAKRLVMQEVRQYLPMLSEIS